MCVEVIVCYISVFLRHSVVIVVGRIPQLHVFFWATVSQFLRASLVLYEDTGTTNNPTM